VSEFEELALRCEKAEKPSDELDCAIYQAVTGKDGMVRMQGRKGVSKDVPAYTGSLDAAMTLVPEGCVFNVMTDFELPGRARVWGSVSPGQTGDRGWQADAATPALSLLAAALRSRVAL
jgi:hypothetical protein